MIAAVLSPIWVGSGGVPAHAVILGVSSGMDRLAHA
jgi:hypothetical protein